MAIQLPDPNDVIYPRPPSVFPVMLQRWHEITFFHWPCDPGPLERRLPEGLQLDTFDGKAWISLTPFLLTGLRPPLVPRALGLTFPEMNLRTYVTGPEGPAIWFFSLDAARLFAVWGARATFGLPYIYSNMSVTIGTNENYYMTQRPNGAKAAIRIAKEAAIAQQSELDIFLTARFRLYSLNHGRLMTAQVQHPPWQLNRVRVLEFEETIRRSMGLEFTKQFVLAHHSSGVDTRIGLPQSIKAINRG